MSRRKSVFILAFVAMSVGGYLVTKSLYPAFAFVFGAWGMVVVYGDK